MTKFTRRQATRLALASAAALPLVALSTHRARAATHQINISGFAFDPEVLEVANGDTIIFTNSDGAPHTATSLDGSFDTGTIRKQGTGEITVTDAGEFEYKCNFHPAMMGVILVV